MPDPPSPFNRSAFADESFLEANSGGYYVLAAAVIEHWWREHARQEMLSVRGGRKTAKSHWTEMDRKQRKDAATRVAAIEGVHIVAIGAPVPIRRQERARAICLRVLVHELADYGVESLLLESRSPELNARDIRTVIATRHALPRGRPFSLNHEHAEHEPLLWVADIVAGAVRAHRHGDAIYQEILADRIYDIDVDTGY